MRTVVGDVVFERGARYAREGRVRLLGHDSTGAAAIVTGTSDYDVQIETAERGIAAACSCPFAEDGFFCKHGVATVLVWLRAADGAPGDDEPQRAPGEAVVDAAATSDEELLREILTQKPLGELVDLLTHAAQRDGLLRARLLVDAGALPEAGFDQDELRRALVNAFSTEHFIGFHEASDYFCGIEEVLGEIDDLIDAGFPGPSAELCLFALDLVEEFSSDVDDSAGRLLVVIEQIEETHLRASRNAEPGPGDLAATLVGRALTSDYEIFHGAAERYADVLGEQGLVAYRDLVEERWQALPARTSRYDHARSTLAALREQVAEAIGGADALLAVLEDSAEGADGILSIAKVLHDEGRDEEALGRLARGMDEHRSDPRLRSLAARSHHAAGRTERAGELLWQNMCQQPWLGTYRELSLGAGEHFPRWRGDALALLTTGTEAGSRRDGSEAVAALLWEGAVDEAWTAAHERGCAAELWLRLARARAEDHPGDALPVLVREAESVLEAGQRPAYQQGAALLCEARVLAERTGGLADFEDHVRQVRERNRRRPALQDEFTRAGLPR